MAIWIWSILQPFGIFCGFSGHLVYFSRFGMLHQEKSGNPGREDWCDRSIDLLLPLPKKSFTE
jgi:hypothetical protein